MVFTIAIPTYNSEKTIECTLLSCLNQKYSDEYEILVVDNNSQDGTKEIICRYSDEIRVIENNKTVSMYRNHNVCLENARGEYVLFCHSDDELLDDCLLKMHSILEKRNYPKRYVLWGRSMFRDFSPSWEKSGLNFDQVLSGINTFSVFLTGGLTPSGTCYSRESFSKLEGFYVVHHKLALSDTITYWKLIFNYFEFEMSSRIFFKREIASTAMEEKRSTDNVIEALIESFNKFKKLNESEIDKLKNVIEKENPDSFHFNIAFYKVGFISKKKLINKMILNLLLNPLSKKNIYNFYKLYVWLNK